jgi:hypothetical protein
MKQIYLLALCTLAVAACSDSTSPDTPSAPREMTMTFSGAPQSAPSARIIGTGSSAFTSLSASDESNTLVITRAQLVLDEFRLKKVETAECADDDLDASNSSGSIGEHSDACERIEGGPMLLDLPLTAGAGATVGVTATEGTYRELEMRVRTVESHDDDAERAFLAANPDFDGISVRIEGTFNGQPFVYTSDVDAELEIEFPAPLVVDHSGMNVTVNVDVASWFRTEAGILIDPLTASLGGENAALIAANIEASFRAFHDDDRDGHDDDGPDHH